MIEALLQGHRKILDTPLLEINNAKAKWMKERSKEALENFEAYRKEFIGRVEFEEQLKGEMI